MSRKTRLQFTTIKPKNIKKKYKIKVLLHKRKREQKVKNIEIVEVVSDARTLNDKAASMSLSGIQNLYIQAQIGFLIWIGPHYGVTLEATAD